MAPLRPCRAGLARGLLAVCLAHACWVVPAARVAADAARQGALAGPREDVARGAEGAGGGATGADAAGGAANSGGAAARGAAGAPAASRGAGISLAQLGAGARGAAADASGGDSRASGGRAGAGRGGADAGAVAGAADGRSSRRQRSGDGGCPRRHKCCVRLLLEEACVLKSDISAWYGKAKCKLFDVPGTLGAARWEHYTHSAFIPKRCKSAARWLHAGEWQAEADHCPKFTGKHCRTLSFETDCPLQLGADCEKGKCMCPPGACFDGGVCRHRHTMSPVMLPGMAVQVRASFMCNSQRINAGKRGIVDSLVGKTPFVDMFARIHVDGGFGKSPRVCDVGPRTWHRFFTQEMQGRYVVRNRHGPPDVAAPRQGIVQGIDQITGNISLIDSKYFSWGPEDFHALEVLDLDDFVWLWENHANLRGILAARESRVAVGEGWSVIPRGHEPLFAAMERIKAEDESVDRGNFLETFIDE